MARRKSRSLASRYRGERLSERTRQRRFEEQVRDDQQRSAVVSAVVLTILASLTARIIWEAIKPLVERSRE